IRMRSTRAILLATLAAASPLVAQRPAARAPYLDAKLPVERRVADLLGRMTLEEKVGQMISLWQGVKTITDSSGRFNPSHADKWFRVGIGRIERASGDREPRAHAEFVNAIQRWVKDSTRLGIPVLFHEEALHGLAANGATSFPQAIALA